MNNGFKDSVIPKEQSHFFFFRQNKIYFFYDTGNPSSWNGLYSNIMVFVLVKTKVFDFFFEFC